MGRVRIVTDSTADIPASLASELEITVVPVQTPARQEVHQESRTPLPKAFNSVRGPSPDMAPLAKPPLERFVETYGRLLGRERGDIAVSIHSEESARGTVDAAWHASQMLFDPSRVQIIDTGQLSMGMGWVAVEAARAAQAGAAVTEVRQAVQDLLPRVRTAAMINDLETLHKGGQITVVSAAIGSLLGTKVLASLQGGELVVREKVRTPARGMKRLVEQVREWEPLAEVAVLHTGAGELAHYLSEAVQDLVPARRVMVLSAGPSLAARVGLDALGVAAVVLPDR
jgi:DegV family protein with EDD domain